jgi:hypothetical protein
MKILEKRLYPALLVATRTAFTRVRQEHAGERFYTFGLFIDGEALYIQPTACTEEALLLSSHGYAKTPIRWNPSGLDSNPYLGDPFEEVCEILSDGFDPDDDQITISEFEQRFDAVLGVCVRVLKGLDGENIFGSGIERQSILLNVFTANDSDEDRVEQAKRLNPLPLVKRYAFELKYCREWPPEVELPAEIPEDYF